MINVIRITLVIILILASFLLVGGGIAHLSETVNETAVRVDIPGFRGTVNLQQRTISGVDLSRLNQGTIDAAFAAARDSVERAQKRATSTGIVMLVFSAASLIGAVLLFTKPPSFLEY
jgi:hypothetical protein